MFKVGDRVHIHNTPNLIAEVRGQYGVVRKAFPSYISTHDNCEVQSINVELDNGAQPTHLTSGEDRFYMFISRYVELVAPREPDWEI